MDQFIKGTFDSINATLLDIRSFSYHVDFLDFAHIARMFNLVAHEYTKLDNVLNLSADFVGVLQFCDWAWASWVASFSNITTYKHIIYKTYTITQRVHLTCPWPTKESCTSIESINWPQLSTA